MAAGLARDRRREAALRDSDGGGARKTSLEEGVAYATVIKGSNS
jgi:hypothetical protein